MAGCGVLPVAVLPDAPDSAVDSSGYTVEQLPVVLSASYARGTDVYLGCSNAKLYKADDNDLSKAWIDLNSPLQVAPKLVLASAAGGLFVSADHHPLYRSTDGGQTWSLSLDAPIWRMAEDDLGNLYAGNYIKDADHVATLYKTADAGATWEVVFRDPRNNHIHTVRWDDRAERLYIAYGDSSQRGQAYSDDRGGTWVTLAESGHEGHTDVTFTADDVIWATDDQSGRILRVNRKTGTTDTLWGSPQFMWFAVSDDQQVYVGTVVNKAGERAALLASSDQGATWQKLAQTDVSQAAYDQYFSAESRFLSAGKWLYFTTGGRSYRTRRTPQTQPG